MPSQADYGVPTAERERARDDYGNHENLDSVNVLLNLAHLLPGLIVDICGAGVRVANARVHLVVNHVLGGDRKRHMVGGRTWTVIKSSPRKKLTRAVV